MSEPVDWFNMIAIERGLPPGWTWYESEAKGERPHHVFIIKGGVPGAVFKSGKNKGKPNVAKWTSPAELVISAHEMKERKAKWEKDTGLCSFCTGSGQTFASYSTKDGTTTRDCAACKATGKAPALTRNSRETQGEGVQS